MEATKSSSPTLQGIPPELRTEIYTYLAISEPRDVSGPQLVNISKESQSSSPRDLRKKFQSAIGPHPLTFTCHQMHTEFNHALATTPGQTYNLIVDNLDLEQLTLFHRFLAANCSSYGFSGAKIQHPPLLSKEVTLSLHLDGNVLKSIAVFMGGVSTALPRLPHGRGEVFDALAEIRILPQKSTGSSVSGGLTNGIESESLTVLQAKSAREAMRLLCEFHEVIGLERKIPELMLAHFNDMVNSHWSTRTNKKGDWALIV